MNKDEKKKLIWKYFWQQKMQEVGMFLLVVAGIFLIPYGLGNIFGCYFADECNGIFMQWMIGVWALLMLILLFILIFFIGYIIREWFHDNWVTATKRVEMDIKCGDRLRKIKEVGK